jgi:hypothetical protein
MSIIPYPEHSDKTIPLIKLKNTGGVFSAKSQGGLEKGLFGNSFCLVHLNESKAGVVCFLVESFRILT